jgi:hypothetical protein
VLIVVGGLQPTSYTTNLLLTASADPVLSQIPLLLFPAQPPGTVLSAHGLRHWLDNRLLGLGWPRSQAADLIIWAFSAGCVGAVGLAHYWQRHRGQIRALFALDGWGVPLSPALPIYRLSHDRFTHVTSAWLGAGPINFYADPPVPHLALGQYPALVEGWQTQVGANGVRVSQRLTGADFLCHWSRDCIDRQAGGFGPSLAPFP